MRLTLLASLLISALCGCGPAAAQAIPPDQPAGLRAQPVASPDFLDAVTQLSQFETKLAHLALARSSSGSLREVAERIVRDQDSRRHVLSQAAEWAGLPPPRQPGLDLGQAQVVKILQAAGGADFDRTYVRQQRRACRKMIDLLRAYADTSGSGPIRHAALQLIPRTAADLASLQRLSPGPD